MSTDLRMKIARGVTWDGLMQDVTAPDFPVQVSYSADRKTLWINIGPACVLRVCRINELEIKKN